MKNEKSDSTKNNNKKLNKKTATVANPNPAAMNNTTGASQKVRPKAGRGLNNEGTNVSYAGEDHDG